MLEKTTLLSNLYTLRAGLSLAYEKKAIADNIVGRVRQKSESTQKSIEAERRSKLTERKKYEKIYEENAGRGSGVPSFIWAIIDCVLLLIWLLAALASVFFVINHIVMIVLAATKLFGSIDEFPFMEKIYGGWLWQRGTNWEDAAGDGFMAFGVFVVPFLMAIPAVGFVMFFIEEKGNVFTHIHDLFCELGECRACKSEASYAQSQINMCDFVLNDLYVAEQNNKSETQSSMEIAKTEAAIYIKTADNIMQTLVNTYGNFLRFGDWGNIDLIIYYIESLRAESIKEALQQVDMQRRTEKIIYAIGEARDAVCRSVQRGLFELRNDMRICFKTLSDQMSEQSRALNANIQQLNQSIEINNAQQANLAATIVNEGELNRALMEKSNVASQKMVEEVSQIRQKSDYAYYLAKYAT